jgi:hypothetical protein
MVIPMRRLAVPLLLAAACGNPDNLILGGVGAGPQTPIVIFDNINSAISGRVTLADTSGNPTGSAAAVIISDKPGLCEVLAAHPDYFRNPPEAFEAMILFTPTDNSCVPGEGMRLGFFLLGRQCDDPTSSEIVATTGPTTTPSPFVAVSNGYSYISLTNWSDGGGFASGSFDLFFVNPSLIGVFEFSGRFKTQVCPALGGVLLP